MPFGETPLPHPPVPSPVSAYAPDIKIDDLKPRTFRGVNLDEVWTLYYRHGMSAENRKNFHFKGTLKEARLRAERHCAVMGYRFHFLRPLIVDIDYEERWKSERGMEPL